MIYNKLGQFGFGISKEGAVGLGSNNQLDCYSWEGDKLENMPICSNFLVEQGKLLKAQRALTNFYITNEFISNEK